MGNNLTKLEFTDSDAVDVEGIRFETLVPESVLTIPENQPNTYTPVQFSISITNFSPNPYRFLFFYLLPEIQALNGQNIRLHYARNATRFPEEYDFLLVQPGGGFTYFLDSRLEWNNNSLVLRGKDKSGGIWIFYNFAPGTYQLRFTYENNQAKQKLRRGEVTVENLWIGRVSMPFKKINLARLSNILDLLQK